MGVIMTNQPRPSEFFFFRTNEKKKMPLSVVYQNVLDAIFYALALIITAISFSVVYRQDSCKICVLGSTNCCDNQSYLKVSTHKPQKCICYGNIVTFIKCFCQSCQK